MIRRSGPPSFDVARNVDAGGYLENFLVAAVVSILGIRLYLELTGYPQLGGGRLHIAHMLWGGLLMLVALVLLLSLLGKRVKRVAAVIGGLGFGAFIDELGKFITADNDYFFQPTVAMIYVILMLLFMLSRQLERRRELTPREALVNAADMIKEVILDRAHGEEISKALALLERSGQNSELAEAIRQAVVSAARAEERPPSFAHRLAHAGRQAYSWLIRWRWFHRAVVVVFTVNALLALGAAAVVVAAAGPTALVGSESRSFATVGRFVGSSATTLMVVVGVVRLVRSRLAAYRWFKRSILISIFYVQVFLFLESQLAALGGLLLDLVLLSGLNYMLRAEYERHEAALLRRSQRSLAGRA